MVFSSSSTLKYFTSPMRVMISLTRMSLNSKMFWIISFSSSSIVPESPPDSTIILISASETASSSLLVFRCRSLRMRFVALLVSQMTGLSIVEIATSSLRNIFAIS